MLTAALTPGAADSPTTNPVSPAGWGHFYHEGDPAPWGFGLFHHDSFGESPGMLKARMIRMEGVALGGSGLLGTPLATVCLHR